METGFLFPVAGIAQLVEQRIRNLYIIVPTIKYAGIAQLVEQRIRNAQVVGSSPTPSSKNTRFFRKIECFYNFFAFFLTHNFSIFDPLSPKFGVMDIPFQTRENCFAPQVDPHGERLRNHGAGSDRNLPRDFPNGCAFSLYSGASFESRFRLLHSLRDEVSHLLCGILLHLASGMGVGGECEAGVVVPQHTGDRLDVHAVPECHRCECVSQIVEAQVLQSRILEDLMMEIYHRVGVVHVPGLW